ncbi:MAG: hypothetical protein HY242_17640 [Afipia sp.]|nr:hypothetical protein [Afipia sp.]
MGIVGFALPGIVIIGELLAVIALAFVIAVHGDWRLVFVIVFGFFVGLLPFVARPPMFPTAFGAIFALILIVLLTGLYVAVRRWLAATICALSALFLISAVLVPVSVRPVTIESLRVFGAMLAFTSPLFAALCAKEIALRFKPLQSSAVKN